MDYSVYQIVELFNDGITYTKINMKSSESDILQIEVNEILNNGKRSNVAGIKLSYLVQVIFWRFPSIYLKLTVS